MTRRELASSEQAFRVAFRGRLCNFHGMTRMWPKTRDASR